MKINCHIYPVSLAVPFQGCSSLGRTGHWCHLLEDIYWTSCARGKHQDGLQSIHMATPLHHVVPSRLPQDLSLEVFFSPLYSSITQAVPLTNRRPGGSVQVWSQPMALCCPVSPCHRGVLTVPVSQDCPMILPAGVVLLSVNLLTRVNQGNRVSVSEVWCILHCGLYTKSTWGF